MANNQKEIREPSMLDALIPLIFMTVMLSLSIVLFGIDASLGPLQVSFAQAPLVDMSNQEDESE
jgi:NhaC family Na+:H+ antiporter